MKSDNIPLVGPAIGVGVCLLIALFFVVRGPDIKSGTIYQKEYQPAHREAGVHTQVVPGPNGTLSTVVIPYDYDVPDKWYVYFKKWDEGREEWRSSWRRVEKETYDAYQVGDEIEFRR